MECPECQKLARLRSKSELGAGQVYRIYRCEQPECGHRFTTVEQYQGPPAWGGRRMKKLTPEDAAEIKALLRHGKLTNQAIAELYNVSGPLISRIANGWLWRGIKPVPIEDIRPRT